MGAHFRKQMTKSSYIPDVLSTSEYICYFCKGETLVTVKCGWGNYSCTCLLETLTEVLNVLFGNTEGSASSGGGPLLSTKWSEQSLVLPLLVNLKSLRTSRHLANHTRFALRFVGKRCSLIFLSPSHF